MAFLGCILLAVTLLFIQGIGNMWMTGGMVDIFFSFALWLGLFGAIIWWVKYTIDCT